MNLDMHWGYGIAISETSWMRSHSLKLYLELRMSWIITIFGITNHEKYYKKKSNHRHNRTPYCSNPVYPIAPQMRFWIQWRYWDWRLLLFNYWERILESGKSWCFRSSPKYICEWEFWKYCLAFIYLRLPKFIYHNSPPLIPHRLLTRLAQQGRGLGWWAVSARQQDTTSWTSSPCRKAGWGMTNMVVWCCLTRPHFLMCFSVFEWHICYTIGNVKFSTWGTSRLLHEVRD